MSNNPINWIDSLGLDWELSQSTGQLTHVDNETGATQGRFKAMLVENEAYVTELSGANTPWLSQPFGYDALNRITSAQGPYGTLVSNT